MGHFRLGRPRDDENVRPPIAMMGPTLGNLRPSRWPPCRLRSPPGPAPAERRCMPMAWGRQLFSVSAKLASPYSAGSWGFPASTGPKLHSVCAALRPISRKQSRNEYPRVIGCCLNKRTVAERPAGQRSNVLLVVGSGGRISHSAIERERAICQSEDFNNCENLAVFCRLDSAFVGRS